MPLCHNAAALQHIDYMGHERRFLLIANMLNYGLLLQLIIQFFIQLKRFYKTMELCFLLVFSYFPQPDARFLDCDMDNRKHLQHISHIRHWHTQR